uniref:Fatty acid synthase n=1 Tax=Strigamia maritima TaxID=126957 RepID=T1JE63_STRMM
MKNEELLEDIVISGISGRFPQSDNVWAFRDHLLNGCDMVTENESRWPLGLWGLPRRSGKLNKLSKFDANFFGVHAKQAHAMAPELRILLEVTFEAIFDAGINPESLRGSDTGVFLGVSTVDSEDALSNDPDTINGYEITGFYRCMLANRISFTYDLKGPSMTVDTGCSASLAALHQALLAIRSGECEACLVGGANLCLNPVVSLKFQRLGLLSPDGKCKSFDSEGLGYVRSEAVVALFIQRAPRAKRVYASILHCKLNNDGYKEEGQTYPSGKMQEKLLRETYKEANISPADVVYVEADGTGTRAGDSQELAAVSKVFCENRTSSLLIGSVKSNMGHAEAAAGLCSIIKVLVAAETGVIPSNLHCRHPMAVLTDMKIKVPVVRENTKWYCGLVGVSSIGFGGLNAHVVLRCFEKSKEIKMIDKMKIFLSSGRTSDAVDAMLGFAQNRNDKDICNMFVDLSDKPCRNYLHRGFTILNSENSVTKVKELTNEKLSIWYIFSGFGSQWLGMGFDLMCVDVFKQSIEKSGEFLKPFDINLYDLIVKSTEESLSNLVNVFVLITAIQVALVDLLNHLGVRPDGIVGHSLGETACAYADGCLTREQTVLAAYWRGRSVLDINSPKGMMAVAGLSWEEASQLCPPGIETVCHNTEKSVTIAGDKQSMKIFVQELASKKVFVKEVNTLNVAFHCRLIKDAAPILKTALQKIIPNPKPRSDIWLSSSVEDDSPEAKLANAEYYVNNLIIPNPKPRSDIWLSSSVEDDSPEAKLANAEYYVNNLVNPVLFHKAISKIPKNAILIEIAPHCLLSPLLNQSLDEKNVFVSFAKRTEMNHLEFFLKNLGKLYVNGVNCRLSKLFAPLNFPVCYGTPTISPLVGWDHTDDWTLAPLDHFLGVKRVEGSSFTVDVSSHESDDYYLVGHIVDGKIVYPAAGYLIIAWKAIANAKKKLFEKMMVEFKDVLFERIVILTSKEPVKFFVKVSETEEHFVIWEKSSIVCSGRFSLADNFTQHSFMMPITPDSTYLDSKDIYKKFALKGYDYGPTFQGIVNAKMDGTVGNLKWVGNWVAFIENMLQFSFFSSNTHDSVTGIENIKIDPQFHLQEKNQNFSVIMDPVLEKYTSGGIEITGIKTRTVERMQDTKLCLEENRFISYFDHHCFATLPNLENEMSDYYLACMNEIRNGLTKWMQIVQFPKLEEILKEVSNEIKTLVNSMVMTTSTDICFDSYLHPLFMKPLLDIVRDNTTLNKLIITEANATGNHMCQEIVKLFKTQPSIEIDYIVSSRSKNELPAVDPTSFYVDTWDVESQPLSTTVDLVIGRNLLNKNLNQNQYLLKNIMSSLKNDGFALFIQLKANDPLVKFLAMMGEFEVNNQDSLITLMEIAGFKVISIRSDGFINDAYLIRKVKYKETVVLRIDETNYDLWMEEVENQLRQVNSAVADSTLWLISNDQPTCGLIGLVNHLRKTEKGKRIRSIFNSSFTESKSCININTDLFIKDLAMNVYRNQNWGFFSRLPLTSDVDSVLSKHAYVAISTAGDLSSLKWFESPIKYNETAPNLCYVYYAAINHRDFLIASGNLTDQRYYHLGMEFAGRNKEGQRVLGLLPHAAMATTLEFDPELTWRVPDTWSLAEAATIPLVYTTVYYALIVRGRLQEGESVLIHYGSGGIGQAAIQIALSMKCCVYTTIVSKEKKKMLMKIFPQLRDENIAYSIVSSFEDHVLQSTNGQGVDVVLNLLSQDKLEGSMHCLSYGGRFLEIGNRNFFENKLLAMSVFSKNISFHGIFLDSLLKKQIKTKTIVHSLIQKGIDSGTIRPLDRTVFEEDQLEDAIRFVSLGKHFGKVLIKLRDEEDYKTLTPSRIVVLAQPQCLCHPRKSYVIVEGLTGLGLQVSHWLVQKGAKFLVLVSRTEVCNNYFEFCLFQWRQMGIDVKVIIKNFVSLQATKEMLKEVIEDQGAVGGIFILTGSIDDVTAEELKAIYDAKILGTHNFDVVSRRLCPSLDWFVVFGKRYCGFADSAAQRICERRIYDEFPALVIQLGDVENVEFESEKVIGTGDLRISSVFSALENLLCQNQFRVVSCFVLPQVKMKLLVATQPLVDTVTHILGISATKSLISGSSLIDLGMDSIIGLEIRQTLEKSYNINLSNDEIRQLTIGQLQDIAEVEKLKGNFSNLKLWKSVNVKNYDLMELVPSKCIVKLNLVERSDVKPLFVVHSVEGNTFMFKVLAEQLSVPVYGIQLTPNVPKKSVAELAQFYIHEMQKIQPSPPYNLASYSVGCSILFEMAIQLQNLYFALDATRALMFLEGSHLPVSIPFLQTIEVSEEFQDAMLSYFVFHFTQADPMKVKLNLKILPSLKSKMDYVIDTIMNLGFSVKREKVKLAAQMFFSCAQLVQDYFPKEKLKFPVTLLRATNNDTVVNKLGIDYSLGKVCRAPVRVEMIDGEHETFLQDPTADHLVR